MVQSNLIKGIEQFNQKQSSQDTPQQRHQDYIIPDLSSDEVDQLVETVQDDYDSDV